MSEFLLSRLRLAVSDPRRIEVIPAPTESDATAGSISLHLGRQYVLLDATAGPLAARAQTVETPDLVLRPGQFMLARTFERIRLPADIGGYFVGLSIWGRRGLIVASATAVMPGWLGYLTVELTNLGDSAIRLHEGMSIGTLYLQTVPASPEPTLLGLGIPPNDSRVTVYSYTPIALFDPQETPAAAHLYTEAWSRNYEAELRLGALHELEALIADPHVIEADLQNFFEEHPWMILGDQYIEVRPQLVLERADGLSLRPDFFLKPVTGDLWDILDIKRPFKNVVVGTRDRRRLSAEVREGVAQLRELRRSREADRLRSAGVTQVRNARERGDQERDREQDEVIDRYSREVGQS